MIHHATQKKANGLGVTLTETQIDGNLVIEATDDAITFTHPRAKVALAALLLERSFRAEYPALHLFLNNEGEWTVEASDEIVVVDTDVPDLATVLEAAQELGVDPEQDVEDTEEEREAGSVVPEHYRAKYREQGHPSHCGDWIAEQLDGIFEGPDRFEVEAFTGVLVENGVKLEGKWAELRFGGQHGAIGRYRMNGRQKLEFQLAKSGVLRFGSMGRKNKPLPDYVMDSLRTKYKRRLTKQPHEALNTGAEVTEWEGVPDSLAIEVKQVFAENGKDDSTVTSLWRHFDEPTRMALNLLADQNEEGAR